MKIKIKINEAIDTPGMRAAAAIRAERETEAFDAEDMDREIEAQVSREEGKKELRRLLDQSPFLLPAIKKLMEADMKQYHKVLEVL